MKEKRTFSGEQKAQIVLSVLKKEVTALEASKKHNIAPSLVYKWQEEFLSKASTIFETNKTEAEKDRKMKHYEHVIAKITTQNDFLDKILTATR